MVPWAPAGSRTRGQPMGHCGRQSSNPKKLLHHPPWDAKRDSKCSQKSKHREGVLVVHYPALTRRDPGSCLEEVALPGYRSKEVAPVAGETQGSTRASSVAWTCLSYWTFLTWKGENK